MPLFKDPIAQSSKDKVVKLVLPVIMTKFNQQAMEFSALSKFEVSAAARVPEIERRQRTLTLLAANTVMSAADFSHLLEAPLFKGSIEYKNMSKALVYHFGLAVLKTDVQGSVRSSLQEYNRLKATGIEDAEYEAAKKRMLQLSAAYRILDNIEQGLAISERDLDKLEACQEIDQAIGEYDWVFWLFEKRIRLEKPAAASIASSDIAPEASSSCAKPFLESKDASADPSVSALSHSIALKE